ncbi:hypothetical protein KGY73_05695 [bacterium]|nr:hypothetical protein [bacterium]
MKEKGQPLSAPSVRGKIHPDFDSVSFRETLALGPRLLEHPGVKILLQERNRVGKINLPLNQQEKTPVVIKEFRTQGVDRLKSLFLSSKASKAWKGGMALFNQGIPTPLPVAYLEKRSHGFVDESVFLSRWIEDAGEIRDLFQTAPPSKLKPLLSCLAHHLAFCHQKGLFHKDLSDGNILVQEVGSCSFQFYLIDTNRIRTRRKIGRWKGLKNLIRLGIPLRWQRFFLRNYLNQDRVKNIQWLWYRGNKKMYTGWVEMKKKLGLRKLSQKLKIQ